ncbi:sulfatase-like hydrolase/transferase [Natrinema halophilum]|uniref:Sulfatase-like hydrolase/transferase n=1 Tax=Natrinema halophilum TaxID=1699371 RepID=A0A7D5KZC6_9EURY|nr:sulfatase-like hydrolase/transferase [Natrinema halophilum]QLG48920.1 sulfatase-like hydrolase/transferase [Natrinema halophilum]
MNFRSIDEKGSQGIFGALNEVDNVCVFMADALRWDHLPESIAERGLTVKTIAASLTTHTSVPTMLTGLWPRHHGVLSRQHQIPDVPNLLDIPDLDDGYYMPGDESVVDDGTFSVLKIEERRELGRLDSPWTYFERHHGGHVPFEAAGWEGSWDEFVEEFAGNIEKHRHWYEKAVSGTVEDFEDRLATIRERGEESNTLIVFTSDHGEYLGEAGLVDHSSPMRPEGVYVPTVFIHPDIPAGTKADHVMRHVDLFPTILDSLDQPTPEHLDGESLSRSSPSRGYSLSTSNVYFGGKPRHVYESAGIWDADGGWVRNQTALHHRALMALGLLAGRRWKSKNIRRSLEKYPQAVGHYVRSREQFGDPRFSFEEAVADIEAIESVSPVSDKDLTDLSEDTEERLQDLGYL